MEDVFLWAVHAMCKLGEYPVHILEAGAKEDGLVSVLQQGQLQPQPANFSFEYALPAVFTH